MITRLSKLLCLDSLFRQWTVYMITLFHVSCNSGSHLGFDSLIFNFSCSKCSLWLPLIIIIIIWGWGVPVVVTLKLKFVCVCVCGGQ